MDSFISLIENPNSKYTWPRLIYSALRAPTYHIYFEILLIIGIVWLLFKRSYKIQENVELTEKEKLTLIREWTPDSLVPAEWEVPAHLSKHFHVGASTVLGKYVEYENKDPISSESHAKVFLNLSSFNFLNFVGEKRLNEAAIKSMHKYGVGSCGPRGFYGTFDVHLDLEQILEKFLGVEEVAVYSYGFSTVASAIPSYAKRTDVIFADEGISLACFQGLVASRSRICFFRHNDLAHLEQLLMKQALEDQKDMKKAQATRRFLVIEGLYLDYGDICPLPELIALKYKYKVRIILDETVSFGVLGSTGRGVTEHFGIEPEHIDLITGSLELAVGVFGGFCAGSKFVVDHQRLSGQGYCFSASLPPMLAAAATTGLELLIKEQGSRQSKLRNLAVILSRRFASSGPDSLSTYWQTDVSELSAEIPVKHIRLQKNNSLLRLEQAVQLAAAWPFLESVTSKAAEKTSSIERTPLLLTVARHLDLPKRTLPLPSIRISLNYDLTLEELTHICNVLLHVGRKLSS